MPRDRSRLLPDIEKYSNSIKANPKDINAHLVLAETYHMLGAYPLTERDCTHIITMAPNHSFAHFGRSDANFYQEKYKQAVFYATCAITLTPTDACPYLTRAAARAWLGDFRGAIFDYTKAIELKPNDAIIYYFRAICRYWLEDFPGTLSDVRKYLQLEPNPEPEIIAYEKYLNNYINNNSTSPKP